MTDPHRDENDEPEDPALEAALLEGLEGGPGREADDAFWADLRRRAGYEAPEEPLG